jgi:DNA-binding MarR family transcriptional regulator
MNLQAFFPYRLAVLANAVSQVMAQVYGERFALSRDEWRVIAALQERGQMRTTEVIAHTTLDKMQVSRAVARLEKDGLIQREEAAEDRRNRVLSLTPAGKALVKKIVPLVLAREDFLLASLSAEERTALDTAMRKLQAAAETLVRQG